MSSPAVNTQLIDRSYYQAGFTNEVAAYVGYFEKGPTNTPVFITDVNEFKFIFGRGIDLYHNCWYQVYNYLQYAKGIWVVRASGNKQWNANNLIYGDFIYIDSKEDFDNQYNSIETVDGIRVIAKTAGESGNLLAFAMFGKDTFDENKQIGYGYKAKDLFSSMNFNESGIIIFRNGKPVEKYQLHDYEVQNIRTLSKYCYIKVDDYVNLKQFFGDTLLELQHGSTNFATDDDFRAAHEILKNKDSYDIDIIIGNQLANELAIDVATSRKDCIAFIGLPTRFINFLKVNGDEGSECLYTEDGMIIVFGDYSIPKTIDGDNTQRLYDYIHQFDESTYVHFTSNIKMQKDGFTGKSKLVNIAADVAGLKSKASLISPWVPGAGLERGEILNADSIHVNFDMTAKKKLYQQGLNFIEGGMVVSQKTFTTKPSAFDRIHARSLFNHIEKTAERILRRFVFEENREAVRRTIALELKNLLNDVKANRGIDAGRVEVRPSKEDPSAIIIDVYIKPTYVTEFVQLRMTNTGANTISSILSSTLG